MPQIRTRRAGLALPLVILTFIVTAVLAIAHISATQSSYAQDALVAHGLVARDLALAAVEEARGVAADAIASGAWRAELLDACTTKASDTESPVPGPDAILTKDLLAPNLLLPEAVRLAGTQSGAITQAQVEFIGFRRIGYDVNGCFLDPESYYRAPAESKLDDGDKHPEAADYIGYYRLTVQATFGRATRSFSELHDVKIVSTAPPAREFVLFSDQSTNGTPGEFVQDGLSAGGPYRLYPSGTGRVFVRGPFVADTEGYPTGVGGASPTQSTSYLDDRWNGWEGVPSPRAGVRKTPRFLGIIPTLWDKPPQGRPRMTQDSNLFAALATQFLGSIIDVDPGFTMTDGTEYFCESRDADGRAFSICGDPTADGSNGCGPDMFRGIHVVVRNGKLKVVGSSDDVSHGVAPLSALGPDDPDEQHALVPEGQLKARVGKAKLTFRTSGPSIPLPIIGDALKKAHYDVTVTEGEPVRYGLYFEPERTENGWAAFLGALFDAGKIALLILGGLGEIDPETAQSAMNGVSSLETLTSDLDAQVKPGNETGTTSDPAKNAYAPGWRPLGRAVTRRYSDLTKLIAAMGGTLALDGVVAVDRAKVTEPIAYAGRGVLQLRGKASKLPGVIVPAPGRPTGADWLTIQDERARSTAHEGKSMIDFAPDPGGGAVVASIAATEGIGSSGAVEVYGNLTCAFPNKDKVRGSVTVRYHKDALKPDPKTAADWMAVVASPRTCQFTER